MVDNGLISNYYRSMMTRDVISLISKIREKVNQQIQMEMSQKGLDGIVTSHGDILYALLKTPRMTMTEIAHKIGKDKSTVTTLIEKLVKLGYVGKERDTQDSRIVYVELTSKGLELEPVFEDISEKILNVFYSGVSEDEKEEVTKILSKIYDNF